MFLARLIVKENPETSYPLEDRDYVIGRSEECDIQVPDGFVSRRQARLTFDKGAFILENTGSNPIFVNNRKVDRHVLVDSDQVTMGKTDFIFRREETPSVASETDATAREEAEKAPSVDTEEEKTVLFQAGSPSREGARLVIATPGGESRIYPLKTRKLVIGRAADADLRLEDPSVSRRHCVIEREKGGYVLKSLTYTNPVTIDGQPVNEKPLASGDHFRIGACSATFLSDRPEDYPTREEKVVLNGRGRGLLAAALVALVLLSASGYGLYRWLSAPLKLPEQTPKTSPEASYADRFKTAAEQIEAGDFPSARNTLGVLLQERLTPQELQKVTELLSRIAIHDAQQMAEAGNLREARQHLSAFLAKYGAGEQSKSVQDRLDLYRLQSAQQLERAGDHLGALREFSAIAEDSTVYDQAQQALSRIWLSYQQKQVPTLPIPQLLEQADEHFREKRYTTPVNNNAYVIYQLILATDPQNPVAKERIEQMKEFYREHGERYFQQKHHTAALSYFQRYALIDPDDPENRARMAECKRLLRKEGGSQRSPGPGDDGRSDDRFRDLLEGK
ncbi:MAG: FHA domain-containing protein [Deltaproteobacteria bacterium]|nr:FHA domain-containing protein [Deltaproteobacteria bacterium]